MTTIVLGKSDVRGLLNMTETIEAVEQALGQHGRGEVQMPAKVYLTLEEGDFRAMPVAVPGAAAVKWVNVHPGNPSVGLPTVMAVLIYNDSRTGYPLAVMDATDLTAYRTGAVAAVASKYMARRGPRTLGIIGAGRQAQTQLLAHTSLFIFDRVKVFDVSEAAAERMVAAYPQYPLQRATVEEACRSDIVCTVTPARQPVVKREWVLPGTHINAMGADAPGKEELDASILGGAIVVVDDLRQAAEAGEINVPIRTGLYHRSQVYGTLGEIVARLKPFSRTDTDITVFDSTGLAIQDIAAARVIYNRAKEKGGYVTVDLD